MSEEQTDYKALYEQIQAELSARKAKSIENKKRQRLLKAGYTEEQAERYLTHVTGETDEEIKDAVSKLTVDIPPKKKYAEPSAGNSRMPKPKTKDLTEVGRSVFQRLKERRKIRKQ